MELRTYESETLVKEILEDFLAVRRSVASCMGRGLFCHFERDILGKSFEGGAFDSQVREDIFFFFGGGFLGRRVFWGGKQATEEVVLSLSSKLERGGDFQRCLHCQRGEVFERGFRGWV